MKIYHCMRCNRDWTSYQDGKPLRCGKCKSPYWDKPRRDTLPAIDEDLKRVVANHEKHVAVHSAFQKEHPLIPAWAVEISPRSFKVFQDKYGRMPLNLTEWETYVKRGY